MKKLVLLVLFFVLGGLMVHSSELQFPRTTFQNLTVNGDLFLQGDILTITDQELNGSFLPTNDNQFDIGSASKRWKDGFFSGNIGIGTTTPSTRLHVLDTTTSSELRLEGVGADMSFISIFGYTHTNPTAWIRGISTGAGQGDLAFYTNPSNKAEPDERIRINDDGNVGIGTSTPEELLVVSKSNPSSATALRIDNADATQSGQGTKLSFYQSATPVEGGRINNSFDGSFWNLILGTSDDYSTLILENGNVGINELNPGKALVVSKSNPTAQTTLRIDNSDPAQAGTGGLLSFYQSATPVEGGRINTSFDGSNWEMSLGTNNNHNTLILEGGKVGIGTTNPTKPFHAIGDANISGTAHINLPMGEIFMEGNTAATTINTAGQFEFMAGTTNLTGKPYLFDMPVNNKFRYTGTSNVMCHLGVTFSISSAGINDVIQAKMYRNDMAVPGSLVETKLGSSGDVTSTAIHTMPYNIKNGDNFSLYIANLDSTADLTVKHYNLFGVCMNG